jgi:hypothetical protein
MYQRSNPQNFEIWPRQGCANPVNQRSWEFRLVINVLFRVSIIVKSSPICL